MEGYREDGPDFPEVLGKCSSTSVLRWQDRRRQTQAATKEITLRHYQKKLSIRVVKHRGRLFKAGCSIALLMLKTQVDRAT